METSGRYSKIRHILILVWNLTFESNVEVLNVFSKQKVPIIPSDGSISQTRKVTPGLSWFPFLVISGFHDSLNIFFLWFPFLVIGGFVIRSTFFSFPMINCETQVVSSWGELYMCV